MFNPTKDSHLDMTPVDFEKYAIEILRQQVQGMVNCLFEHNKIIEVSDGNYQIDGYIEFSLMGVTYKTLVECKHYKGCIEREKVQVLFDKLRACGAQKGILVSTSKRAYRKLCKPLLSDKINNGGFSYGKEMI